MEIWHEFVNKHDCCGHSTREHSHLAGISKKMVQMRKTGNCLSKGSEPSCTRVSFPGYNMSIQSDFCNRYRNIFINMAWLTSLIKPLWWTQHTLLPLKNMTFTATMLQASLTRVSQAFGWLQAKKLTGWNINLNHLIPWVSFSNSPTLLMITRYCGLRVGWFWTFWGMWWTCWITYIYWRGICPNGILKFAKLLQWKYVLSSFLYQKLF